MQKKRKSEQRLSTAQFSLLWITWSTIVWGIIGLIASPREFNELAIWLQVLIVFGVSGILLTHAQNLLLKLWMGTHVKYWVPGSNLSWLIGSVTIYMLLQNQVGSDQAGQMVFGAIFTVPAVVQAYLLRNRLQQTWVWALAGAVSGILLVLPMLAFSLEADELLWLGLGMGGTLIGLVQTLVLDRLRKTSQSLEKQKNEVQEEGKEKRLSAPLAEAETQDAYQERLPSDAFQQERQ